MDKLPPLNLPRYECRLRAGGKGTEIFDRLRRQWVVLTPEEWVRQHFVNYLIEHLGFPPALMANEVGLRFNGMLRRCDTVVFNKQLRHVCVVEYKAPTVAITQKVFDQIARYNSVLQARYLIVSNGLRNYCCEMLADGGYRFLAGVPDWSQMQEV